MNKSSDGRNASDTEVQDQTGAPMQAAAESARLADPHVPSEATERRSPHRVISTASYYHPERRGRVFGGGSDEFPEEPEVGSEMDGDSGDDSFR
ncbi:MAG: hypothetical protein BGO99_04040 [Nitrosospira sp. 56-18]|jgi:hypothetical protein|nr:hypothetical protein [Nitrosospira sp.]OJY10895.1 MAG: hypothetical protein BGO99_04040 [Nitrosospira sp. 56-18]